MTNPAFFLGLPRPFKKLCKVYPPLISEIVADEDFGTYQKLLTMSQEEVEDEIFEKMKDKNANFNVPTPLEFLLANAYHNKIFEMIVKKAFEFFIHEPVSFLYEEKLIIIGDIEKVIQEVKSIDDLKYLSEENFFDFQNLVRESMGEKPIDPPNPNEDPRIKRMKAKARYRDRIKAKKGLGIKLSTTLSSICCMGLGITPLNIGEMSYVATMSLISTYQEKEKYDIDVRSLLAGADSKKIKPKYWIRNLDE